MPPSTTEPLLKVKTSPQILTWLDEQKLSIAITTYQVGKLILLGLNKQDDLSIIERTFQRCMGMCRTDNGLYVSSLYQIWQLENVLQKNQQHEGFDKLYIPQVGYTTGGVDTHDMAVDTQGKLIFVNTSFSCLATLSHTHSFKPFWKPHFIDKLVAEDRCHLNGLAMKNGQPAYVTAISQSNHKEGWRNHRFNGGVVINIENNSIVATGLSMPHSPRWYRGKLWLLNSGTGEFGYLDVNTGYFESVCFCAGFMRGLSFQGDFAIIGLSKPRKTFNGLALEDNLKLHNKQPQCGIQIINLKTGNIEHWLYLEGIVNELYDVVSLPKTRCPMMLGFKTDEIQHILSMET